MLSSLYPLSRVPSSLDEVTTIRPRTEIEPRRLGLDPVAVDAVWDAVRRLYRSGIHPAIQLCVRRRGAVILDRAIGHARGNGPDDAPRAPRRSPRHARDAVQHLLRRQGRDGDGDPPPRPARCCSASTTQSRSTSPASRVGKQWITIRHVLSHRAGHPERAAGGDAARPLDDPEGIVRLALRRRPHGRPGHALAYHAITGGFILGELVQRVTGRTIRDVLRRRDPPPARLSLARLRRRARGRRPGRAQLLHRAAGAAAAVDPAAPRARAWSSAAATRDVERPALPHRRGPGGEPHRRPRTSSRASTSSCSRRRCRTASASSSRAPSAARPASQSYLEIDFTLGLPIRYGMGFMLGGDWLSLFGPDTGRRLRAPRLHQHRQLGRPRAAGGRGAADQRQAPRSTPRSTTCSTCCGRSASPARRATPAVEQAPAAVRRAHRPDGARIRARGTNSFLTGDAVLSRGAEPAHSHRMNDRRRPLVTILLLLCAAVLASSSAANAACRQGASALGDERALASFRATLEDDCPCASFDGSAGQSRSDYRRCSSAVLAAAQASDGLSDECVAAARPGRGRNLDVWGVPGRAQAACLFIRPRTGDAASRSADLPESGPGTASSSGHMWGRRRHDVARASAANAPWNRQAHHSPGMIRAFPGQAKGSIGRPGADLGTLSDRGQLL